MEIQLLDLYAFHEIVTVYKDAIYKAPTSGAALASADECLDEVARFLDHDIKTSFHQEVAYLWSMFPERHPQRRKNHDTYKEILTILLEQSIEAYWYAGFPKYNCDHDVYKDKELYNFGRFRADVEVKFMYVQYYRHIGMRVPNALRLRYRRLVNHPGRYTQGLTTVKCKKSMLGLINQLCEDVTYDLGSSKPLKILVNSLLRTVEYQCSLAQLGYIAPRSSSHVVGYGVDLERVWYKQYHTQAYTAIQHRLDHLVRQNIINAIDEGTHWHVCLNPEYIQRYEQVAETWRIR